MMSEVPTQRKRKSAPHVDYRAGRLEFQELPSGYISMSSSQLDSIMRALKLQTISNIALSVSLILLFAFLFYVFLLGDVNNFLSRAVIALEAMAR